MTSRSSSGLDAVVVGAGPAGAAAALVLARAGREVCLLERGPFPGSKNMYGGVVYGRVLDTLLPRWWEEAPVQRWVVRRATMVLTEQQALSVDYRSQHWGQPPYNGATTFRPDFDRWLASKAVEAGATLLCDTTAVGLLGGGSEPVAGVRTDRAGGDLRAPVVIACDGVNSFLAREAGLVGAPDAHNYTLGAKEVLALPAEEIDRRFGLERDQGADFEILGCTAEVPGGGFLYTNRDSVSVGVVLRLPELAASKRRAEDLIAALKVHPAIAPLVAGGELIEYSAHLIPEGGFTMVPPLAADGLLVAGDAAALCLAAGIWLEGVNFAIGSGMAAGETAVEALAQGDISAEGLAGYRRRLEGGFVLADHRRLQRAPQLVLSERVQQQYPALLCNLAEAMFTVTNPQPKRGLLATARAEARRSGVRLGQLARDGATALRIFG